jgi:hypothetical protein
MTAASDLWQEMQRISLAYQVRNGGTFASAHQGPFYLGGWVCSGCCRGYSPAVLMCPHCGPKPAIPGEDFTGGPEHDLCVPLSEGGLCDHDDEPQRCTGGRYCGC